MPPETPEIINKNDALYKMVENKFGVNRTAFRKSNRARLAQMAWVTDKEYKWTEKQNNAIRNRILANKLIPLPEDNKIVKDAFPKQWENIQVAINQGQLNSQQMIAYATTITDKQKVAFALLSPPQMISFLQEEMKGMVDKATNIQEKTWVKNSTAEELANRTRLVDLQKRLDIFVSKNKQFESYVMTDKQVDQYIATMNPVQKDAYSKLIAGYHGDEQEAKKYLKTTNTFKNIQESKEYANLSDASKAEFATMVTDFYIASQWLDIDVSAFGLDMLYSNASQSMIDTYSKNGSYQTLLRNINGDNDINEFFKDTKNRVSELVPEQGKDKVYYKKLLTRYPWADTLVEGKKISEYLDSFDDTMKIKSDATANKKILDTVMKTLKDNGKQYEDKLLDTTNALTQDVAINQCVSTLQRYMDIDINTQDNIAKQLTIADEKDAVSPDLTLHIDGRLNGKKVKIFYNLKNWAVSYQSFLTQKDHIVSIGTQGDGNTVPLMTLPKLGSFVDGAKNLDYPKLMESSATLDEYKTNFTAKLQQAVPSNTIGSMGLQKDMLKRSIINDMITQNIVTLTWRDVETENTGFEVTESSNPAAYSFYNFIYTSLDYYSMRSIDQLQSFQTSINTFANYRKQPWASQSVDTLHSRESKNQEMFVLQTVTNKSIIPDTSAPVVGEKAPVGPVVNQWPEAMLWSFFKCFEQKIWGISVIDVDMMADYIKATETMTPGGENKKGSWERNDNFNTLFGKLSDEIWAKEADANIGQQINLQD